MSGRGFSRPSCRSQRVYEKTLRGLFVIVMVMKDFIFIAGAPGSGKSTIAKAIQAKLDCPLFEFGWIPEFQNKGHEKMSYVEEEGFAFENLTLVAKNYTNHGFKNVIITDLNNDYIQRLADDFSGYDYLIFTLRLNDNNLLKSRVEDETRSSGYRDSEEAIRINKQLLQRKNFKSEIFIDINNQSIEEIVEKVLRLI